MRTIVIGDIHGCLEEFNKLLEKTEFKVGQDRLVLVGDLVDRGPFPRGVLERARLLGAESVMGNHEEKHLRFRRHEQCKLKEPRYKNPMNFSPARLAEHKSFQPEDWAYLEKMPYYLRLSDKWVVVHAGFFPGVKIEEQYPNEMMRIRNLRKKEDGKWRMLSLDDVADKDVAAPYDPYWTELWEGPESVIYGHNVYDHHYIMRVNNAEIDAMTVGIDTGCCFGGALTAAILIDDKLDGFVHVPARYKYAERK